MASDGSEAQPLSAPPADRQVILHGGKRYVTVKEGLAHILFPETAEDAAKRAAAGDGGAQPVFYNPIQQFNRDLTVLAIKAYASEKLGEKQVARRNRASQQADKKRKRQERKAANQDPDRPDRPAQAQKVGGDTHPGADAEREVAATEAAAATAETAEPAESAAVESRAEPEAAAQHDKNNSSSEAAPVPEADKNEKEAGAENADKNADKNADRPQKKPPSFTILDALSATGLRALRYAHEMAFVTSVTANDLLASAAESIRLNVEHNGLGDKIAVSHDDAVAHMYTLVAKELRGRGLRGRHGKSDKYDVIDLDPYGTAAPFLDAAVQAVRDDGGLLCVTCTDSGVWASNGYPEKAFSLYGGIPMKGGMQSHEGGLRLILHAIVSAAARYGLAVEPLLSLSIDYYARVFVRVRRSPASVKFQAGRTMVVYSCDSGCSAWTTQVLARNKAMPNARGTGHFYKHVYAPAPTASPWCEHCGSPTHLTGPMYAGRIHSPAFIRGVLAELAEVPAGVYGTADRVRGMLQTALEEFLPSPEEAAADAEGETQQAKEDELAAPDPYPFFFIPTHLAGKLHSVTPPEGPLRGALINLGYRVTRSHCKPSSIKTDAPWPVIWRVMKEWARQKAPIKEDSIKPGSPAHRLWQKQDTEGEAAVVFDEKLGRDPTKGLYVRYQTNPRENWGPMVKAKARRGGADKT